LKTLRNKSNNNNNDKKLKELEVREKEKPKEMNRSLKEESIKKRKSGKKLIYREMS